MTDFENLKNAFMSTVTGVAGIAKELASTAGDKAKALARIARVSVDVSAEKENVKKAYAEIGRLYYENNRYQPGEMYFQLFDEVRLAEERLELLEQELAELKSQVGDVPADADVAEPVNFEDVVAAAEQDSGIEVEITEEPKEDE